MLLHLLFKLVNINRYTAMLIKYIILHPSLMFQITQTMMHNLFTQIKLYGVLHKLKKKYSD